MKVQVKIYLLKDSHGNKTSCTAETSSDTVQVCGMKNKHGSVAYFESDAYHLPTWCQDNHIDLKVVDQFYDFDGLWSAESGSSKILMK